MMQADKEKEPTMNITFSKDKEAKIKESIKQYFYENMETEIGDLKAMLLLDFFLKEIGPSVYNLAIHDAQAVMMDKVEDLESSCYQPEFMYWQKS
jgi:uncharacterized protein (DUF2164 family)